MSDIDAKRVVYSGRVQRWHKDPQIFPQSDGEHAYNCAIMAMQIAEELNERSGSNVVVPSRAACAMLVHDIAEEYSGDMPGGIKGSNPVLNQEYERIERDYVTCKLHPIINDFYFLPERHSNHVYQTIGSFCDNLDALLKLNEEFGMGNVRIEDTRLECARYMEAKLAKVAAKKDQYSIILYDIFIEIMNKSVYPDMQDLDIINNHKEG